MKKIIILFGLLLALPVHAQLYQPGEQLDFKVSYKAKLFPNTEMATVRIATTRVTVGGETFYQVVGHAKTLPAFRLFMRVDDRYTIRADVGSLKTRYFESKIQEGDYSFRSSYVYDWSAMKARTNWKSGRMKQEKQKTIALTATTMDPVSLFFRLRTTIDRTTLKKGETRTLNMLLEDTVRRVQYRFVGREEKKIRQLGTFKTLKFRCQLGTSQGFSFEDGSEFTIWISDDQNMIPLYIESPVKVGSVQAYISSYKGLKYAMSSFVK